MGPGEASKVMTGGTLPPGSDAVVPVERTSTEGETVSFAIAPEAGAHIRKLGEIMAHELAGHGPPVRQAACTSRNAE